ncbi:MAG: hypothetical protein R3284_06795 [Rubricoccaceae bacterium]|nr:hypothetical protein [Rubricoccaceae bacterium]
MTTATSAPAGQSAEYTPPHPESPLNGAVVDGAAVTFAWHGVDNASDYILQIASDRQFARDVLELHTVGSTSISLHNTLPPISRPYFWRVRATLADGETRWSPYGRFFAGNDAQVDAFQAEEEARLQEERREAVRIEAERQARLDLIPYVERDDTIPNARLAATIGSLMIFSVFLVAVAILLAMFNIW